MTAGCKATSLSWPNKQTSRVGLQFHNGGVQNPVYYKAFIEEMQELWLFSYFLERVGRTGDSRLGRACLKIKQQLLLVIFGRVEEEDEVTGVCMQLDQVPQQLLNTQALGHYKERVSLKQLVQSQVQEG
eukprot:6211876-Pleurochrysis_carterae.AAC.1